MVRSMSGHGRGEASSGSLQLTVEVRAVNHRYCRLSLRLPGVLAALEEPIRHRVSERIHRGKVDLSATLGGLGTGGPRIHRDLLDHWLRELRDVAQELGTPPVTDLQTFLTLPGVVGEGANTVDSEELQRLAGIAVDQALDGLDSMRRLEGKHLVDDLATRVTTLHTGLETIAAVAQELPERIREQLQERIGSLLVGTGVAVDEARIVQEAAYHAERSDVTEEVVRLSSHLTKLEDLMQRDEAVGRTLEFVVQEVHRELNTIGSKVKDLVIADTMVELKAELERIREQVQNIE